jgi:hypothetical protein
LEVIKGQGSFIFLNNKDGYFCPFCNRAHENENPYVLIKEDGSMYFSCRRNPQWHLCYIGKLDNFEHITPKPSIPDEDIVPPDEDIVPPDEDIVPISNSPSPNAPTYVETKDKTPSPESNMPRLKRLKGKNTGKTKISVVNEPSTSLPKMDSTSSSLDMINSEHTLKPIPNHDVYTYDIIKSEEKYRMPKIGHRMRKNAEKQQNKELMQRHEINSYNNDHKITTHIRDIRNLKIDKLECSHSKASSMDLYNIIKTQKHDNRINKLNSVADKDQVTNYFAGRPSLDYKNKEKDNVMSLYNIRKQQ